MALKITHKYDDIIGLSHPISSCRSRMSCHDRAAQFAPFAALTGFDSVIAETSRLTDTAAELDEEEISRLDALLRQLQQRLPAQVIVTYFVRDPHKPGGAYRTERVQVKRICPESCRLLLRNGGHIHLGQIVDLQLPEDK